MIVYVLEVADDSWEIYGVYLDKTRAEEVGLEIVESPTNKYEHYHVTGYVVI
jgi:hypothetical protein